MARRVCRHCAIPRCWRLQTIWQLCRISTNRRVRAVGLSMLIINETYFSVMHTIRNRYAQHSIYTYSGIVLIAVNPFQRVTLYGPEIIQAYSGRRRGDLEPHLFAIAEDAYTAMRKEGMGQTIIVSGERWSLCIPFTLLCSMTLVLAVRAKQNQ